MLNVIIADDENKIRNALKKMIRWDALQLNLLCECEDGDTLLSQTTALQPDIVITDMRMPGINGEKLLQALRAQNENVKILVLSGFDEFELVRQAIVSKAVDYLLKPVSAELLNNALLRVIQQCDGQKQQQKMEHAHYLETILRGSTDDRATFLQKIGIAPCENQMFCIAICTPYTQDGQLYLDKTVALQQQISAQIDGFGCAVLDKKNDGSIIVMLSFKEKEEQNTQFTAMMSTAQAQKICLVIGVGTSSASPSDLVDSYQEAIIAFYNTPLCQLHDAVAYYQNLGDIPPFPLSRQDTVQLLNAAAENVNFTRFETEIVQFYDSFAKESSATLSHLYQCNTHTLQFIKQLLSAGSCGWSKELQKLETALNHTIDIRTSRQLTADFLQEVTPSAAAMHGEKKEIAYKIQAYLQEKYCEKISLQDLANHLYLTKEYVSKLFRQEFSIGIFDYIDILRIEKAKKLLQKGATVHEVTEQIGYYDESHLNRKFKKYAGVAPKDYKGSHGRI